MKICERGWDWVGLCFQFQLIWFPQTRADAWAVLQQVQSQLPLFLAATSTSFVLRWEPQRERETLYHRESWSFELDDAQKYIKVYKSPCEVIPPRIPSTQKWHPQAQTDGSNIPGWVTKIQNDCWEFIWCAESSDISNRHIRQCQNNWSTKYRQLPCGWGPLGLPVQLVLKKLLEVWRYCRKTCDKHATKKVRMFQPAKDSQQSKRKLQHCWSPGSNKLIDTGSIQELKNCLVFWRLRKHQPVSLTMLGCISACRKSLSDRRAAKFMQNKRQESGKPCWPILADSSLSFPLGGLWLVANSGKYNGRIRQMLNGQSPGGSTGTGTHGWTSVCHLMLLEAQLEALAVPGGPLSSSFLLFPPLSSSFLLFPPLSSSFLLFPLGFKLLKYVETGCWNLVGFPSSGSWKRRFKSFCRFFEVRCAFLFSDCSNPAKPCTERYEVRLQGQVLTGLVKRLKQKAFRRSTMVHQIDPNWRGPP